MGSKAVVGAFGDAGGTSDGISANGQSGVLEVV